MHPTIWATVLCFTLMVTLLALGDRFHYLKRCYFLGIHAWAQWLPVVSTALFFLILISNITGRVPLVGLYLSVTEVLTKPELVVLAVLGLLFLTRSGNLIGMLATLHLTVRIAFSLNGQEPSLGMMVLLMCATFIMILGDKAPWLPWQGPHSVPNKIREILSLAISFGSLAVIIITMIRVSFFSKWTFGFFGVQVAPQLALALLGSLFMVWVTITLGLTRHFTLPMIALPTLYPVAFVTGWPGYALMIPFAACLALTLASAERRIQER